MCDPDGFCNDGRLCPTNDGKPVRTSRCEPVTDERVQLAVQFSKLNDARAQHSRAVRLAYVALGLAWAAWLVAVAGLVIRAT